MSISPRNVVNVGMDHDDHCDEIVPSCLTRLYNVDICAAPVVPELWEEIFPILSSGWVADPIPDFETYMRNSSSFPVPVMTVLSNDEIRRA